MTVSNDIQTDINSKTHWHRLLAQAVEPIGLTPEYVLDLGRREWLASMMSSMPREELMKIPGAAGIWQDGEKKVEQKGEQKGRQEGEAAGEQRGEKKGEAKLLVRLLTRRFGELSAVVHAKISAADSETLEKWGDLVLDARSLEDVLGPDLPGTH